MNELIYRSSEQSVAGAYVAVALLAGLLLVASYPVQFGIAAILLAGSVLVSWTVWRQATTRGLTLRGSPTRLRVKDPDRQS